MNLRTFGALAVAVLTAAGLLAIDPHLDPSIVTGGCTACHDGHGQSGSPMLKAPQSELCLRCHGTSGGFQMMVGSGQVAGSARPTLLNSDLQQSHTHPLDQQAFSGRHDAYSSRGRDSVTCTSCHSPHRGNPTGSANRLILGQPKMSARDPNRFEYELCQECHGSAGPATQDLNDISRLTTPTNPSYHPVQAPTNETSPSIRDDLAGLQVNCTDCHGNADLTRPPGLHGSSVPYILNYSYTTTDGSNEGPRTYALCYRCHERERVIESSPFPEHGSHVSDIRASCATCHNPHGSVSNRALIRYGEDTAVNAVSPSMSTGRLEFVSDGPGSGACYLNCHSVDHGPKAYGAMKVWMEMMGYESPLRPTQIRARENSISHNR